MKFGEKEVKDLAFAGFMISLAFAVLLGGGTRLLGFDKESFFIFGAAFLTGGLGFLLHEVMHKFVAQKYGLWAEFRANYGMLWLSVLMSFFGFIFESQ